MTSSKLLSETEASIKLGITPELLFEYTRFAPKSYLGHKKTLMYTLKGDERGFLLQDLEDWDAYLQEPWARKEDNRPAIPKYIQRYLKVECGGRCALCGTGHKLEDAHIIPYEESLSHYHHNLIRLCKDCHSKYDDGIIPHEHIETVKAQLIENIRQDLRVQENFFSKRNSFYVPQPNSLFVGRESELATLKHELIERRLVIIQGIGGIGKTQLLLQALKSLNDGISTIWLDVESFDTLQELETALFQGLAQSGLTVDTPQQTVVALRNQELRVVLDGLDHLAISHWDDVFDFITNLINFTERPRFVITTQIEIGKLGPNTYQLTVPPLSIELSYEYLTLAANNVIGQKSYREPDLVSLAQFSNGHPLSLKLTSGLINYFGSIRVVVDRLCETGLTNLKDPVRKKQTRSTALQVCLRAVYDCLADSQKRLLQYLSNFPSGCIVQFIELWKGVEDYQTDLAELKRFFLIEIYPDIIGIERAYISNPIRTFTRTEWKTNRYEEAAGIQLRATENLAVQATVMGYKYLEYPDTDFKQSLIYGLTRIDLDLHNYLHAMRYAKFGVEYRKSKAENADSYLRIITSLAAGLAKYFFLRGLFDTGANFALSGIDALEQLQEYEAAVTQCQYLEALQGRFYDYDGMEETIDRMVRLAELTSDANTQARVAMSLGGLAKIRHQPDEAIKYYETAAQHFKTDVKKVKKGQEPSDLIYNTGMLALTLSLIGNVYEESKKQPQQAIKFYQEALNYQLQIDDFTNLGATYHQLGNCFSDIGDYQKALTYYKSAAEIFVDIGQPQFLGNALSEMGGVVVETGTSEELIEFLSKDLLILGLQDVRQELELVLSKIYPDDSEQENMIGWGAQLFRKTFFITKLVSFTPHTIILNSWAVAFAEDILRPILDQFGKNAQFARLLNNAFMLAFRVSLIRAEEKISQEDLQELCTLCYSFDGLIVPSMDAFRWLEKWLKHWNYYSDVTAQSLYDGISKHEATNEPFNL